MASSKAKCIARDLLKGVGAATVVLMVILLIVLGIAWSLGRYHTGKWLNDYQRLSDAGTPLTFDQISAARSTVPDHVNSALLVESLSYDIGNIIEQSGRPYLYQLAPFFDFTAQPVDLTEGIREDVVHAAHRLLTDYESTFLELGQLMDMPMGRIDLTFEPDDFYVPELNSHCILRAAARALLLQQTAMIADGDFVGAVQSPELIANVVGALDQHMDTIGRLAQSRIENVFAASVRNLLSAGEISQQDIDRLAHVTENRLKQATPKWAFLTERARLIAICDDFANGTKSFQDVPASEEHKSNVSWVPMLLVRYNQRHATELLTTLVDSADDPAAMMETAEKIIKEGNDSPVKHCFIRVFADDMRKAIRMHLAGTAHLQCTHLALDAERFRMDNGSLPESLDQLVPDYIENIPTDPFDGTPLKLATTDEGIIIYTVGTDRVDDGGNVARTEDRRKPTDFGFRLLEAEHRGLVILDEPAPETPQSTDTTQRNSQM